MFWFNISIRFYTVRSTRAVSVVQGMFLTFFWNNNFIYTTPVLIKALTMDFHCQRYIKMSLKIVILLWYLNNWRGIHSTEINFMQLNWPVNFLQFKVKKVKLCTSGFVHFYLKISTHSRFMIFCRVYSYKIDTFILQFIFCNNFFSVFSSYLFWNCKNIL